MLLAYSYSVRTSTRFVTSVQKFRISSRNVLMICITKPWGSTGKLVGRRRITSQTHGDQLGSHQGKRTGSHVCRGKNRRQSMGPEHRLGIRFTSNPFSTAVKSFVTCYGTSGTGSCGISRVFFKSRADKKSRTSFKQVITLAQSPVTPTSFRGSIGSDSRSLSRLGYHYVYMIHFPKTGKSAYSQWLRSTVTILSQD